MVRFWWSIHHPTCFRARKCLLGSRSYCTVTKTTKYPSWLVQTRVKQIQDGGRLPSLKIESQPYLHNNLTYRHKIWHGDTYWASKLEQKLKFPIFKNPRRRTAAILSNQKMAISPECFDWFSVKFGTMTQIGPKNQTGVKISNFYKSKMADSRHTEKSKIAISPKRFDRLVWNLARWRILGLRSGVEVKISTNFWKSKMADGRHVEKLKIGHISATVWRISMKFGMVMHYWQAADWNRCDR